MRAVRFGLLVVCLCVPSGLFAGDCRTDVEAAQEEARQQIKVLLLHFYADWCGPCRQMERTVLNSAAVEEMLRSGAIAVKVNVDDRKDLAQKFHAERIPCDVYLDPQGQVIRHSTGVLSPSDYVAAYSRATRIFDEAVRRHEPSTTTLATTAKPDSGGVTPASVKVVEPVLGLEGFCPVTLKRDRKWTKGSSRYVGTYDDYVFHFSSEETLKEFEAHPRDFVPELMGCDPVVLTQTDRAVSGMIEYGAYFSGRLYLFLSDENRREFKKNPYKFTTTQHVLRIDQIEGLSLR